MKKIKIILLLLLSFVWVACSNQWRESDIEIDGKQLNAFVKNAVSFAVQSSGTNNTNDLEKFENLYADPNSRIYYTEGPAPEFGATPEAATPIYDWSFLGDQFASLQIEASAKQVVASRVFMVEKLTDQGIEFGIMFDIELSASAGFGTERVVKVFFNNEQPIFENGEMVLDVFSSEGKRIALRSFDVADDDLLADIIQLEVYLFVNNEETFVGKISTLVSFL